MARLVDQLTEAKIRNLTALGLHADGRGLYLQIHPGGGRSWIYRFTLNGRTRDMGLGPLAEINLVAARAKATAARAMRDSGLDPIEHTSSQRTAVAEITTSDVLAVLKPIWETKCETAARLRGRIERILARATVEGHRTGANPATWRGHLQEALPKRSEVQPVVHHPAMEFSDVPGFMVELCKRAEVSAAALRFLILTAARTGEVTGARWCEIDRAEKIWTVPAGHTGKDEGRGARGSNALPGDADMQNQISAVGEVKIVTTMKANDAPIGELLRFKLEPYVFGNDEDGDPISAHIVASEIIAAQPIPLKKATAAPREGRAVRALRDAIIEVLDGRAETIQIANGQKVKAAAVENVQAEFTKRYVVPEDAADPDARRRKNDAKRKAFDRALDRLAGEFIGCVVGDRQWIYRLREDPPSR
jgi:hypothetical protein